MDSPGPRASTSRKRAEPVDLPELPCMVDGNFQTSYSWHSAGNYDGPAPEPSEDDPEGKKGGWILGVDEAGRGPVLGPQVYGCVACPMAASDSLKSLGFADSKALNESQRSKLMIEMLSGEGRATGMQYGLRVMHPRDISSGMLQRTNYSLNAQSQDVTIQLIRDFLDRNYPIHHVFVDPVGPHEAYEAKLKAIFPTLQFTVVPKADALFPVVSAASIVAKVTRDVFMEVWKFNEAEGQLQFSSEFGSGYPSDPKTVAWLEKHFDPLFGYPSIARQSWGTIRQLMDKKGWRVKWCEEESVNSIRSYFASDRPNEDRESVVANSVKQFVRACPEPLDFNAGCCLKNFAFLCTPDEALDRLAAYQNYGGRPLVVSVNQLEVQDLGDHPALDATSLEGMSRGYGGPAVASTSRQPHPSLPAKPRLQGEFKQQDDFISFNDALSDEEGRDYRGKGKGRDFGGPRGKKRTIGEVLDEQGKRKLKDIEKTTPWTADVDWDAHASATQQLSAEVRAFTEYISPTDQEHELRTCVVESIRRLITSRWRDAQVHAFGSFETRLYLPTGDIDLVIVSPSISREKNAQKRILFQISGLLKSARLGTDIVVIGKARVPIVKFVTVQGGFKVDISLNMMNGIHVGRRVTQLFKEVGEGPARSLIMVTKAFLSQRNMNEVYSGGLGSYSIICLVVSFLQLHPKLQKKEIDPDENLGTLLIEFLELYGKHFNFEEVGICVSSGGSYYSKSKRGWARPNQPYLLSIEDPADPTNDVAGGSHNIKAVQMSLGGAFEVLSYAVYVRTSIILARIAAAQSGRRLPTLSGRAILEPVGEGEGDVDECRKSLLGSIVGVTAEIEKSRTGARTLASTGVVQQSVGVTPGNFDERGQLDNPAARAAKAAQAAKVRARAVQNTTASSVPQPKAPESISGDSHTSSKRKARKLAKAQAASQPNQKDKAAAKAEAAQVVEAAQDGAYAQSSRRSTPVPAVKAPTYINLDSDSESDIAPAPAKHTAVARTKGKAVESDSSDSRYAVKKGRNGTKAADTQYKPNGQNKKSDDNSDSDSDVVLVASSKKGSVAGTSQKANKASTSAATAASPKKRSRKAKQKVKVATSSDMEMSSSESSSVKPEAKQPAKASTAKKGKGKATSPQVKRLAQRKEFWSAKGQVNNHSVSSDSDSDNVYVRSK